MYDSGQSLKDQNANRNAYSSGQAQKVSTTGMKTFNKVDYRLSAFVHVL